MLQQGNIDLTKRPRIVNPDGSISTVRSMSFGTDQGEVLVPTAVGDRILSDQEAVERYRRTGEHLGIFDTPGNATAYAQALHEQQDAAHGKTRNRDRARGSMADFPSPMGLPPAGPEPEQQQPRKPFVSHQTRTIPTPTLPERAGAHAKEAFHNTLAGQFLAGVRGGERFARKAEQLDKVIKFAESQGSKTALPLPPTIDPQSGMPIDDPNQGAMDYIGHRYVGVPLSDLRKEMAEAQAAYAPLHAAELRKQNIRRFEYETMPGAKTLPERGAAVVGELAGGLPTPESLIPVTRGATLLQTFARGATAAGLTNLLTDPLVQSAQIEMGTRKAFDPAQPFLGAAGGAFLGGTLNVAPEVAGRVAKVVGARLGKATDAVTNWDVWHAMSSWLRSPDTMPEELKIEPTMGRPSEATTIVAEPKPPREPADAISLESPTTTAAQPQRGYGREPGGGRLERQLRESTDEQIAETEARLIDQRRRLDAQAQSLPGPWGPEAAAAMRAEVESLRQNVAKDLVAVQQERQRRATSSAPATPAQPVFREYGIPVQKTPREPVYQGGVRGEPFVPAQKPAMPAAEPSPVVTAIPEGAKLTPSAVRHGDIGTLGPAAPRSDAQLIGILDRADARRFAPKANAAFKAAAEEQRAAFIAQLDGILARLHAGETGPFEATLQTVRGRSTRFRFENARQDAAELVGAVESLRSRLGRGESLGKFYSVAPGAPPARGRPRFAGRGRLHQPAGTQAAAGSIQAMTPGANYVGAVPQVFNPTVAETRAPIRREDILRDFVTGMGIPLYQGRIKSKRILGFFRPSVHEVRIKGANDIETAAHEMAHYLDRVIPEIRRQWKPATTANATIRQELAGVSYDKTKLYEGWAEFTRLWLTQRNQAQAKAPNVYAWFEGFLNRMAASKNPRHVQQATAIRDAQKAMHAWFDQSAADRAASKIGGDPDVNAGLTRWIDRFRQSVTDDLHGIANMERGLTGKISPVGAYETSRLARAAASITEGALTLGRPVVNADGSHSFVGKGLDQILDPVKADLDDFLAYAVGRSARELKAQSRENLFTDAEIAAMLAKQTPAFRRAFAEYQAFNKAILDFAQAKGAIDPAKRAQWRRNEYLPFYRVSGGGPGKKAAPGAAPGDWRGIRALTGGTQNLRPILSNIVQNAHTLISAALTNEARREVARLASRPGGARFMAKIPKDDKRILIMKAEMERAILEALGVRNKKALPIDMQKMVDQIVDGLEPMTALFQRGQAPRGNDIVAVLHGGKPTYYEVVDPILYRAFSALNRPMRGQLMNFLSWWKRAGQTTVTLTADFMARNIFRDTLMGSIMSRHGFVPFKDSAIGFKSRIVRDQNYREFLANGGGLGSHLLDETAYRKHLERFITRKGIDYRTVLDAPDKLMFALGRIAESFEQATRLGEFRKAIKRGEHPRHAAYSAREVSTDFAMRGDNEILGFLYDTVVFMKAAVNGLDRLGRGLAEDPNRGRIAAKIGLLALASMGLYAVNRGNPLYEQLEDFDKNTYWHVFVPTPAYFAARAQGREIPPAEAYYHFRLPKLWEIGAVGSIAERQLQGVLDGQPLEAQKQTGKILLSQFNVGLPQIIAPAAELLVNRDFFTGRPIENQADKQLLPFARSDAYTSSTLRRLGYAERNLPRELQVSPKVIEHLLHGYFNTWATYGLNALDWATTDDLPALRLDRLPVVSTFYRQEPAQSTRYVTQLYDAIQEANEARRTMKTMARRWEPEIAGEVAAKPENLQYRQMNFAEKRMQEFRKAATMATDAPDLATVRQMIEQRAKATKNLRLLADAKRAWGNIGDLKRLLLDEITRERNAFAETVMKGVKSRQELKATGTQ